MSDTGALDAFRTRIDEIDDALAALFEKRLAVCREIGQAKRTAGRPVRDPAREEAVLKRRLERLDDARDAQAVRALYQTIMTLCADAQNTI